MKEHRYFICFQYSDAGGRMQIRDAIVTTEGRMTSAVLEILRKNLADELGIPSSSVVVLSMSEV